MALEARTTSPRSRAISVVITTHNRANMVGVAIASVLQSPLMGSPEQINRSGR